MAFSWAETITQFETTTKATHPNELRTNITHVRAHTGLAAYGWATTITQYTTTVLASHMAELKTALDAAHTENYCHSYYATHNSAHQVTYYAGQS